jgi:parvulin-like peptidyl-prolyl isomerase
MTKRMRLLAVVATLLLAVSVARAGQVVDQIVATVDREAILLSDVMAEIGPQLNDLRATAPDEATFNNQMNALVEETLTQAIDSRILYREAQMAGMEIGDEQLEKRLDDYKELFDSPEEFRLELERSGETVSTLRDRLRRQILAASMARRKQEQLAEEVVVSESDVAQYYQDHRSDFEQPDRSRVRQIFLVGGEGSDRTAARARMDEILEKLNAGDEFTELAAEYSQAPGAEDGGIIGWVTPDDLVGTLNDAAFSLEPGQHSGVLETDGGFHILQVDEREAAGTSTLEEMRPKIEPELRRMRAMERYNKWLSELRKRSRVQVFI